MRSYRLIPCLDIKDGRVVKGVNFVGLRDAGDPVELAKFYYDEGADELVFLDITASHEGRPSVVDLAARVADQVFIPFTVGGGLRSVDDIRQALLAGADKVSLNTAAIQRPELVAEAASQFGSQCIVVAIDARRRTPEGAQSLVLEALDQAPSAPRPAGPNYLETGLDDPLESDDLLEMALDRSATVEALDLGWEVFTHGGRRPTGLDAIEWAKRVVALGAGEILLTSMDGDGTQAGYDLELTRAVSEAVGVPVIASGGAGRPEHLVTAVVEGKADAVLLASIVHDGVYRVRDLKETMAAAGLPMRLD